ncbi:hypothetical protein ACTZWW_10020 [Salinarimonas sp. NSM]|uniref:hypothetical protein n=1 Tax=Salinarimonas sp. NSM TaxID=3458003 RepID=UPI004035098F
MATIISLDAYRASRPSGREPTRSAGDGGEATSASNRSEIVALPVMSVERLCRLFDLDPADFEADRRRRDPGRSGNGTPAA